MNERREKQYPTKLLIGNNLVMSTRNLEDILQNLPHLSKRIIEEGEEGRLFSFEIFYNSFKK